MHDDLITPAERLAPRSDKRAAALAYLRNESKCGYCLDAAVKRLPAQRRAPSVLDRWLARRSA